MNQYIDVFGMILPGSFYTTVLRMYLLSNSRQIYCSQLWLLLPPLLVLFFPPFLHFVPLALSFCLFMCHLLCSPCLNLNLECKWTEFPTWSATSCWRRATGRGIEGGNLNPQLHRLWLLRGSRLQYVDVHVSEMEGTLLKACKWRMMVGNKYYKSRSQRCHDPIPATALSCRTLW